MSKVANPNTIAQKLNNLRTIIKQHGGIIGTIKNYYWTDDAKFGELVGEDEFGNKYFHNKYYMMGRSRWVTYGPRFGMDYDGSQIPAEWHRWLHYITDQTPTESPPLKRKWMNTHTENFSGTKDEYVPYSTTRPKIEAWNPAKK